MQKRLNAVKRLLASTAGILMLSATLYLIRFDHSPAIASVLLVAVCTALVLAYGLTGLNPLKPPRKPMCLTVPLETSDPW